MELKPKEFPQNYPEDVVDILDAMSFSSGKEVMILGSMSLRSQQYAGDYDAYEVVRKPPSELKKDFQRIILKLKSMPKVIIGDIKCGSVEQWKVLKATIRKGKVVGYKAEESRAKIDELVEQKVISPHEALEAKKLLTPTMSVKDYLKASKELRFHLIRWKPSEVLAGYKTLPDGRRFSLEEGFHSPTITKLDVIGFIQNNRYTDFSIIYEFHWKGKILNPAPVNISQSIKEDIVAYSASGDWFKVMKRLFSFAKYENDLALIHKLTPYLNSDLGRLYSVASDMKTLLDLLETHKPSHAIKYEIDQFRGRLASVWTLKDYLKIEPELLAQIGKQSHRPTQEGLEAILDKLNAILSHDAKKSLEELNMFPLPVKYDP
jgi:hypothetical protein